MKTGIATVSLSGTLREKLAAVAAAGFDGIEIFEQDFIADAAGPREVGAMVRDHGLEILLFQPFRDFEGLPPPLRARAFDRAERKFDLMAELGTDLMLVCSSVSPAAEGGIDRAADDFRALGERAAARGLRVGFEALAWGRHIDDHRDAWEVVRRADHPAVGLIVDSFHTLARGLDPDSIRRIPGDRIFFVQLADAPQIRMDLLYLSRHFRTMPGEGELDVPAFLAAVLATGYAGPVSLEVFNDLFRGGSAAGLARDGRRALGALFDRVRRSGPAVPALAALPALPPPAVAHGIAFVEFASRNDEAADLAALLSTLGFARTGRHRSKSVDLWQQGDIRIVVNTEATGFAQSSWLAHGTGVCDAGFLVDDAHAAAARAVALGADPFAGTPGPGELSIPAIRSIGGSVMHFLDRNPPLAGVWQSEFAATGSPPGPSAGLTRIDHIAETMSYDEMLSWSLFYTTLFEMGRAPMVDVIDPDGLVRSQAIASPDGALRLTLNGAASHKTLAGHFLADSGGAVVQHIAFASGDLLATARALAARGFQALPMPGNYYADLRARFGLGPETVETLATHNLLYDEDEGGAFLQLYGRPLGNGLFFEIVERRGTYQGFGAANAPFRIAAQKRLIRAKGMPRD